MSFRFEWTNDKEKKNRKKRKRQVRLLQSNPVDRRNTTDINASMPGPDRLGLFIILDFDTKVKAHQVRQYYYFLGFVVNCTFVHLFHAEMRFDNLRKLKIKYFSIMFLPHYAFTDLSLDPLGRLMLASGPA